MDFFIQFLSNDAVKNNSTVVAAIVAAVVAVVAALLTFFGVLLSNRSSSQRSEADRAHSAAQSAREREAIQIRAEKDRAHATEEAHLERVTITRRQIYLEAMEAWTKAQQYLINLADKDLAEYSDQTYIQDLASSIAKVTLVAEQNTVIMAKNLHAEFNKTLVNGMQTLLKQGGIRGTLELHEREYKKNQETIEALLSSMKDHNIRGAQDHNEFSRLENAFDAEQKLAEHNSTEAGKIRSQLFSIANEFRLQQILWATTVSHPMMDLVCAMRDELRISTELDKFHEQVEQQNKEAKIAFDTLMESVRSASN